MNINSTIKRICVFGDSITWGACDYEKGGCVERLKTDLLEHSDINVKIPMQGKVNSLNVSIASALMVYEVVRQRSS